MQNQDAIDLIRRSNMLSQKMVVDSSMSKPLTFGELKVGDKFILFPNDGDDSGHGGYRGSASVFVKIDPVKKTFGDPPMELSPDNAVRIDTGRLVDMRDHMLVIKLVK